MKGTTMTTKNQYGNQAIQLNESVGQFGSYAAVTDITGPCTAKVKVVGFTGYNVECYVQRDNLGRLQAIRRVLISDILYS